jgi:hypothetical protein
MPQRITIEAEGIELHAELNESPCARAIGALLPISAEMGRWGDEYYGSINRSFPLDPDARETMTVGELAYWPPGQALCIFFGPTPASTGPEPRAASEVNPIGHITGDCSGLKGLGQRISVVVRETASAP